MAAVLPDWPEEDKPALAGPHPTAAEEGEATPRPSEGARR